MEQVVKMRKNPKGTGRAVLASPLIILYYLFSGACMAFSWLMAAGVAFAVVAEVLGGGLLMVMAFLLGKQAGFMVGAFLFGLALWLLVAPTIMLTREVFLGMKTITKYYIKSSDNIKNRLLGRPLGKNMTGASAI